MSSRTVKLAQIGNSKGIRLPAELIARYRFDKGVVIEEGPGGLTLKPAVKNVRKLSWAEAAKEMAAESDDWADWERMQDGWEDT